MRTKQTVFYRKKQLKLIIKVVQLTLGPGIP